MKRLNVFVVVVVFVFCMHMRVLGQSIWNVNLISPVDGDEVSAPVLFRWEITPAKFVAEQIAVTYIFLNGRKYALFAGTAQQEYGPIVLEPGEYEWYVLVGTVYPGGSHLDSSEIRGFVIKQSTEWYIKSGNATVTTADGNVVINLSSGDAVIAVKPDRPVSCPPQIQITIKGEGVTGFTLGAFIVGYGEKWFNGYSQVVEYVSDYPLTHNIKLMDNLYSTATTTETDFVKEFYIKIFSNQSDAKLVIENMKLVWQDAQLSLTGVEKLKVTPATVNLLRNYPNPFNPTTTIEYSLPKATNVKLYVYNSRGQRIAKLVDSRQIPGIYQVKWNATNFPNGTYLCCLETGGVIKTIKIVFIK